jgi:hypothetical protein
MAAGHLQCEHHARLERYRTGRRHVLGSAAVSRAEPDGWANVNVRRGTIRFWYRPDWTSGQNFAPAERFLSTCKWANSGSTEGFENLALEGLLRTVCEQV